MHLAEIVLPASAVLVALTALRTARRRRTLRMPITGRLGTRAPGAIGGLAVLIAATIAQLSLSGWRWQLAPAAATAALLGLVLGARALGRPTMLAGTLAATAFVGAVLSLALSWALPLRILPAPEGPHAVGTTTFVLRDTERAERYGPTPGGPRELVVQVWYPAAVDAPRSPAPLVPQAAAFTDLGAAELGLPRFALGHVGRIVSNATADVAALDGPLPVALLAHGWTGFRTIQTDLAERLASEGWVVVAADHRYGALVTTFPDGRADLFDTDALPEFGTVPDDVYAQRSRTLIATFADDLRAVLRSLESSPPEQLAGLLDLSRIAFLGHSTGGGAAIAACATEPRCAAVVGFDPWVEPVDPAVLSSGAGRPLLSLRTEDWLVRPNEVTLQQLHRTQRANGDAEGIVGLEGALHRDFTLIGALSPAAGLLGLTGETPGGMTRIATMRWTTRFLDHHVRSLGPDPLREPPASPVGLLEPTP
jgi:predicted dienelactone hydrolase